MYLSYIDIKTYHLNDLQIIGSLFLIIIENEYTINLMFAILIVTSFFIFYFYKDYIGSADLKILIILSLKYNFNITYILLIAALVAIVVILFTKKQKYVPFIPFITLGVIIYQISIDLIPT